MCCVDNIRYRPLSGCCAVHAGGREAAECFLLTGCAAESDFSGANGYIRGEAGGRLKGVV